MKIIGYGEDALTLWALRLRLDLILRALGDDAKEEDVLVFLRPSFGRRGGPHSSEFGEFDFMLVSPNAVYLGESKWHRSSEELRDGMLTLRPEQLERHTVFAEYLAAWAEARANTWPEFIVALGSRVQDRIGKPLPSSETLLAQNLTYVLSAACAHLKRGPIVRNVLLYLHGGLEPSALPQKANGGFRVICIDYSEARRGNFVEIQI